MHLLKGARKLFVAAIPRARQIGKIEVQRGAALGIFGKRVHQRQDVHQVGATDGKFQFAAHLRPMLFQGAAWMRGKVGEGGCSVEMFLQKADHRIALATSEECDVSENGGARMASFHVMLKHGQRRCTWVEHPEENGLVELRAIPEHAVKVQDIVHRPLPQWLVERGAPCKHVAHVLAFAHIPLLDTLVERRTAHEHFLHGDHVGHIPRRNILVKDFAVCEEFAHVVDAGHVPLIHDDAAEQDVVAFWAVEIAVHQELELCFGGGLRHTSSIDWNRLRGHHAQWRSW